MTREANEDMTEQIDTEESGLKRITIYPDGKVDEIAGRCQFHLEDLGDTYYLGVYPEGDEHQFLITADGDDVKVLPYSELHSDSTSD